jgi:Ca2+-binding RTX toxin-like protein
MSDPTSLNVLTGTPSSETLTGASGDDSISGLAGNDRIDGQAGNDVIYGGDGGDTLEGNYGNDTLYGEEGNDTLTDDSGANLLDGGAGDDSLTTMSLSGNSTLLGGLGNDVLYATGLTASLSGGGGNDSLEVNGLLNTNGSLVYVQGGSATLDGGAGNDSIRLNNYSQATLKGGEGDDTFLVFTTRSAELYGEGGKDDVNINYYNYNSRDTDGNASLSERYLVDGGADDDTLTVSGTSVRGSGQITVVMRGGSGNDKLTLSDSAGNSIDNGFSGVSQATLEGGEGDDEISVAGVLQATLTGGGGVDTFKLMAQQCKTLLNGPKTITTDTGSVTVSADPLTITDFGAGTGGDVLDYSDLLKNGSTNYDGSNPFASGYLTLVQSGTDTLLKFDPDGSAGAAATAKTFAILKNVTANSLVPSNFNPNYPRLRGFPSESWRDPIFFAFLRAARSRCRFALSIRVTAD